MNWLCKIHSYRVILQAPCGQQFQTNTTLAPCASQSPMKPRRVSGRPCAVDEFGPAAWPWEQPHKVQDKFRQSSKHLSSRFRCMCTVIYHIIYIHSFFSISCFVQCPCFRLIALKMLRYVGMPIHILQRWKNVNCKTMWNIRGNDMIETTNTYRLGRLIFQDSKGIASLPSTAAWVKHVATVASRCKVGRKQQTYPKHIQNISKHIQNISKTYPKHIQTSPESEFIYIPRVGAWKICASTSSLSIPSTSTGTESTSGASALAMGCSNSGDQSTWVFLMSEAEWITEFCMEYCAKGHGLTKNMRSNSFCQGMQAILAVCKQRLSKRFASYHLFIVALSLWSLQAPQTFWHEGQPPHRHTATLPRENNTLIWHPVSYF